MIMDVLETLKKLPPLCYTVLPSDPRLVIVIHRGVPGYTPLRMHPDAEKAAEQVARLNEPLNVSEVQIDAMEIGSCFGWHVPAADPDTLLGKE